MVIVSIITILGIIICLSFGFIYIFYKPFRPFIIGIFILVLILWGVTLNLDADDSFIGIKHDDASRLDLALTRETVPTLVHQSTFEAVEYLTLRNTTTQLKHYYPVYLQAYDNYYVVIFSQDQSTNYENARFSQLDYENYQDIDTLKLIDRTTGEFIRLSLYDYIGKTIALDKIQNDGNYVSLAIYYNHSQKIEMVDVFKIVDRYPNFGFQHPLYLTCNVNACESIEAYLINQHGVSLIWLNSGQFRLYLNEVIHYNDSSYSFNSQKPNYDLSPETHLKNGEALLHEGDIYFLGVDGFIYKITSHASLENTYIEADLMSWERLVINSE